MLQSYFCKQNTSYEMRIRDWSSDVCTAYLFSLGGEATVFINDTPHAVSAGDRILIHKAEYHSVATSAASGCSFLSVQTLPILSKATGFRDLEWREGDGVPARRSTPFFPRCLIALLAVAGPVRDDLVGGAVVNGAGIGEDVLNFRLTIEQHVNGKRLRTEGAEVIARAVRAESPPQTPHHAIDAVEPASAPRRTERCTYVDLWLVAVSLKK